ncbi:Uncharacterized protein TCM_016499 [Theobroma cacao]|uniref:Uncharacterized protein n=1 Tax=Theobroma cacao TaxID=3641 RepID=A0A061G684_THECC|nr:Uncharacterized protein TCM_016499 [Theobroma cacao]
MRVVGVNGEALGRLEVRDLPWEGGDNYGLLPLRCGVHVNTWEVLDLDPSNLLSFPDNLRAVRWPSSTHVTQVAKLEFTPGWISVGSPVQVEYYQKLESKAM